MRLLVASPWLFPRGGGLERYAHTLAVHLARRGFEVTCLGHAEAAFDETREGVRRVGVVPSLRLSNTPLGLEVRRRALRLLRSEDFDVVNVHTPVPGTAELVASAARRAGVPYVVTYHAGLLGAPRGPLTLAARAHEVLFQRAMLRRAAGRIAVSPYVAEHVFGAAPSVVVPPGVDAERFAPRGAPVPGRVLFVGPVSRAYAWKGFDVLFEAFCRIAPFLPEAHLRVVGTGDRVGGFVEPARRRGLAERVAFVPRVSDEELVDEYGRAWLVALPSVTAAESFGMVLAEANACGRPVVASRVGGVPGFVEHEVNGLLVPPGDARALAEALARVLEDRDLAERMGREGREKVRREHRWESLAERTAAELAGAAVGRVTGASSRAGRRTPS